MVILRLLPKIQTFLHIVVGFTVVSVSLTSETCCGNEAQRSRLSLMEKEERQRNHSRFIELRFSELGFDHVMADWQSVGFFLVGVDELSAYGNVWGRRVSALLPVTWKHVWVTTHAD